MLINLHILFSIFIFVIKGLYRVPLSPPGSQVENPTFHVNLVLGFDCPSMFKYLQPPEMLFLMMQQPPQPVAPPSHPSICSFVYSGDTSVCHGL
ncbi:hypothetical protein OROMI_014728 [Orobanche minor]